MARLGDWGLWKIVGGNNSNSENCKCFYCVARLEGIQTNALFDLLIAEDELTRLTKIFLCWVGFVDSSRILKYSAGTKGASKGLGCSLNLLWIK